jgi:glutathione S-transferase
MLTLYHAPRSRSSRILWLLEEVGASYDIAYVDIRRGDGSGAADPRNPHPDKKVPALAHDGALVTESAAIVLYLTDLFAESGIGPAVGDGRRGPYLTWLAYYAGVIEPVVHFGYFGLDEHDGLRSTFRGRAELDRRILDALEQRPYLLGETFSAADIMISSMGHFARDLLPEGRAVDDYLERCNARPALVDANAKDARPDGK